MIPLSKTLHQSFFRAAFQIREIEANEDKRSTRKGRPHMHGDLCRRIMSLFFSAKVAIQRVKVTTARGVPYTNLECTLPYVLRTITSKVRYGMEEIPYQCDRQSYRDLSLLYTYPKFACTRIIHLPYSPCSCILFTATLPLCNVEIMHALVHFATTLVNQFAKGYSANLVLIYLGLWLGVSLVPAHIQKFGHFSDSMRFHNF